MEPSEAKAAIVFRFDSARSGVEMHLCEETMQGDQRKCRRPLGEGRGWNTFASRRLDRIGSGIVLHLFVFNLFAYFISISPFPAGY